MGDIGVVVAIIFFIMVVFAALTSSISIMEALVSSAMDKLHVTRKKATVIVALIALVLGVVVCFGYNFLYFDLMLPNSGVPGQILDVMDYISNYVLMPVVAIATCVLVGWVIKPKTIIDEVTVNGEKFSRRQLYNIMIKFVTPVMLFFLLLQSLGLFKV